MAIINAGRFVDQNWGFRLQEQIKSSIYYAKKYFRKSSNLISTEFIEYFHFSFLLVNIAYGKQ